MILFSLLIEKLNSWHSWHLPCGKPLRVYGGSLYPAGSRYASTSPFYATPKILVSGSGDRPIYNLCKPRFNRNPRSLAKKYRSIR
ncbi:MAG: hypothetical protein IGR79_13875 [Fischerella thermalis M48_A2018_028]|nr:hypothetical protein [Fischerella thermalis M48_A2018_028]